MSPARSPPTRAGAKKPPRCCRAPLLQPWTGKPTGHQRPPFGANTPENLFSHQFYGRQQRPDSRRRQPHGTGGGLNAHLNAPKQTLAPGHPGPLLQPLHGHITTVSSPPLMPTLRQFPQAHLTPCLGPVRYQETHRPALMPATGGLAPAADEADAEGRNITFTLGETPAGLFWFVTGAPTKQHLRKTWKKKQQPRASLTSS